MDPAIQNIRSFRWNYADSDPDARLEVEHRLIATARQRDLIPYSQLVNGISFRLANVNNGAPFYLGAPDWTPLHSRIIGEFLGRISCDSYERAGFLLSAVSVLKATREPSPGFHDLVRELGLLHSRRKEELVDFWSRHVGLAYDYYERHPEANA